MTYLYDWMLRHNMEIYEWQKSVLHGKLAVVDDRWVTVGSYNINALSDYGSLELNIETVDDAFAVQTRNVLNQLIQEGCIPVNQARFTQRKNWFKQFNLWLSYTLIRMALRLLFGLMQGRKPSHF
jgi:cardiolipin synthase